MALQRGYNCIRTLFDYAFDGELIVKMARALYKNYARKTVLEIDR